MKAKLAKKKRNNTRKNIYFTGPISTLLGRCGAKMMLITRGLRRRCSYRGE